MPAVMAPSPMTAITRRGPRPAWPPPPQGGGNGGAGMAGDRRHRRGFSPAWPGEAGQAIGLAQEYAPADPVRTLWAWVWWPRPR